MAAFTTFTPGLLVFGCCAAAGSLNRHCASISCACGNWLQAVDFVLASKFAFGMKDVKNATSGGGKPKRMSEGVQSGFRKICWMDNGLK